METDATSSELEGGPHSELLRSLMHVYESQAAVHIPIPVDAYQTIREDAELMLGRNVIIAPVADDDTFDAQEVVEGLANRGQSAGTINGGIPITIYIPDNKRDSFHEALRAHLYRRSRLVVEGTGRTAFWKGREPFMEPFMRPALSRSLSLP